VLVENRQQFSLFGCSLDARLLFGQYTNMGTRQTPIRSNRQINASNEIGLGWSAEGGGELHWVEMSFEGESQGKEAASSCQSQTVDFAAGRRSSIE